MKAKVTSAAQDGDSTNVRVQAVTDEGEQVDVLLTSKTDLVMEAVANPRLDVYVEITDGVPTISTVVPNFPTSGATELKQMLAEAFTEYEARQLTAGIRQGDIDPDELGFDHGGDRVRVEDLPADVVLDSLNQHPDDFLPTTVGRPDLDPTTIRAAIISHFQENNA